MSRITDNAVSGLGMAVWVIFLTWAAMLGGLVYGIYWFINRINTGH